ncbi:MAG: hypothetical protein C0606_07565 [Hyphomicrobiales bacterium]|nr:MAG: hypothetical protein C0606_07565 [Hyphomicrobiales bacterium]
MSADMKEIAKNLSALTARGDLPEDVRGMIASSVEEIRSPIEYDLWIYRWVVSVLGILAIITVIGASSSRSTSGIRV